jgi:hypothetical protein
MLLFWRPGITRDIDFLKLLAKSWHRKEHAEEIVSDGGHSEACEEGYLINPCRRYRHRLPNCAQR